MDWSPWHGVRITKARLDGIYEYIQTRQRGSTRRRSVRTFLRDWRFLELHPNPISNIQSKVCMKMKGKLVMILLLFIPREQLKNLCVPKVFFDPPSSRCRKRNIPKNSFFVIKVWRTWRLSFSSTGVPNPHLFDCPQRGFFNYFGSFCRTEVVRPYFFIRCKRKNSRSQKPLDIWSGFKPYSPGTWGGRQASLVVIAS